MNRVQKFRLPHFLKWVSLVGPKINFTPSKFNLYVNGSYNILQNPRFYRAESAVIVEYDGSGKMSRDVRKQAEAALMEYLHSTRSLNIMDAENMSKNSPEFFDNLLTKVDIDSTRARHSLTRFLRYHPVNEFEPFFESIGLKRAEYAPFLPRDLIFLADDELLLENYYALCNYGVERSKIGRIYKEATEVFRYEYGVLRSRLRCFENLGLSHTVVAKIILSDPRLLTVDVVDLGLVEFLEKLKNVGIENYWLQKNLSEEDSYSWECMNRLLCLFSKMDLSEKEVKELLMNHPDLLLDCSGLRAFRLVGFLLKFGSRTSDLQKLLLEFPPQMSISKFTCNFFNCYNFLVEIDLGFQDISVIVGSHAITMGSCELKKIDSLLTLMGCGKDTLREMVKLDPSTLKKWVLGLRVEPVGGTKRVEKARILKTQFLLKLGFVENSKGMEKALRKIHGKGDELQERYDCLLSNGFSHDDVIKVIKVSPQVLTQSSDAIKKKIRFFVDDLGYRVSDLLTHPKALSYSMERLKLRLLTYKWLQDQRAVHPRLRLSTLLSSSEESFRRTYVDPCPKGPAFWERLKKNASSGNE